AGSIQLHHLGKIKHQLRAVGMKKGLDIAKKFTCSAAVKTLRHSLDDNWSAIDVHISSLQPCWGICARLRYRRPELHNRQCCPTQVKSCAKPCSNRAVAACFR